MEDEAETEPEAEDDPQVHDHLANCRSAGEDDERSCSIRFGDEEQSVMQDHDYSKIPAGAASNPSGFQFDISRITMFG
jgi:hypothetical protein